MADEVVETSAQAGRGDEDEVSQLRAALEAERAAHALTRARLEALERGGGRGRGDETLGQLRDALAEKEVLLGEVHHRVKNNLQVISSLLSLQARVLDAPGAAEVLAEAQRRTFAMALVHEKLYQSRDLRRIDLVDYVRSLLQSFEQLRGRREIALVLEAATPVITLSIDHAVPCGLVLHELISHACKHAFPDERRGAVRVGLVQRATGRITMAVADDGVASPVTDSRSDPQRALGLRLIEALVRQLRASQTVTHDAGTRWTIEFDP